MKVNNVLKSFVLALCATLIIVSCNKDASIEKDQSFAQELAKKEHLQKMLQLCSEYGWVKDEGSSQQEFEEFLLSLDYNTTKNFFELTNAGAAIGDNLQLSVESEATEVISKAAGNSAQKATYTFTGRQTLPISGESFKSATFEAMLHIEYDREALTIKECSMYLVEGDDDVEWNWNHTNPTFSFKGNSCRFSTSGTMRFRWGRIRSLQIKVINAYIELVPGSLEVKRGEIIGIFG